MKVTDAVNPIGKKRAPAKKKLVNHIALVVDTSGSMRYLKDTLERTLNEQIDSIKQSAYNSGQETNVSVYTFASNVNRVTGPAHPEAIQPIRNLYIGGDTALIDAVSKATEDLSIPSKRSGDDISFLVITLTDGEENFSSRSAREFADMLRVKQGTDRWSFAFLVPPGGRRYLTDLGVPTGNIQEWELTDSGLEQAMHISGSAYSHYTGLRAAGITATKSMFTDLSGVSKSQLVTNLDDVSASFKRYKVDKESAISDFCKARIGTYPLGKAYYQLTKTEKIQDHKRVVIEERTSKKLYGGDQAKGLIGLTSGAGVTVRVTPGNHANYNIFVNSTSMNRKLVRGTSLLVEK